MALPHPFSRLTTPVALVATMFVAASAVAQVRPMDRDRAAVTDADDAADSDEAERVDDAIEVLTELASAPDSGIPQHLFERAEAIVVVPSMMKGGFIVGAKHGKGIISIRDRASDTWSAPAFVNMTGGSIGWQIGVESVDLVLLVMNKEGVDQLLEDRFTLGGNLSATAGPVGRSADAATNAQMNAGILAYSRSQGLFAGATFEGAAIHADEEANARTYGDECEVRQIVDMPTTALSLAPAFVARWQSAVTGVTGRAAK